jgi:hypothetical protein
VLRVAVPHEEAKSACSTSAATTILKYVEDDFREICAAAPPARMAVQIDRPPGRLATFS